MISDTAMMDGWPAGYDEWMATIHDGWMEEKSERLGPGPGSLNDGPRGLFFLPSIHHGWWPSIHHSRAAIHPSWPAGNPSIMHGVG